MALYKIAAFEAERNKEKASAILKKAMDLSENIKNAVLKFEAFVKLTELQDELMGKSRFL